jgi:hypothetical protein
VRPPRRHACAHNSLPNRSVHHICARTRHALTRTHMRTRAGADALARAAPSRTRWSARR